MTHLGRISTMNTKHLDTEYNWTTKQSNIEKININDYQNETKQQRITAFLKCIGHKTKQIPIESNSTIIAWFRNRLLITFGNN